MTPEQIARLLHGRPSGKGKWQAKCPAHRDRLPSLSITDMGQGRTRLHCFTGCPQEAVLSALGLRWADLTPDTRIDPEILRQIRVAEENRKNQREQRTKLLWIARERVDYWRRKSRTFGRSLAKWPEQDKLARDFHHALSMERRCRAIWEKL